MNSKFYTLLFFILLFISGTPSGFLRGQLLNSNTSTAGSIDEGYFPDLETQLASLDTLINIALRNSPFIKGDSSAIKANYYNVKLAKLSWMENITGFGNFATGSQRFAIANSMTGSSQTTNFLNGYRVGFNFNIPVDEFFTRKYRVRVAMAQQHMTQFKKQQTELEIRREVVAEYNNLIAAQKVLKIKSESLENFRVLHQLAEKQFREGTTPLEEYAYASDLVVKAETDYEVAKASFRTLYQNFEFLLGQKLTTLTRRK